MKRFVLFLTLLAIPLLSKALTVTIKNPNTIAIKNAPVVIKLNKYSEFNKTTRKKLAVFLNGTQISSQLDDLNGDEDPDELVFLLDIKGHESRSVEIKPISDSQRHKFPSEIYTDLILKDKNGKFNYVNEISSTKNDMYNKLHHHGIAFESALIAYRIYFDNKSTIDVYGKKKQQLELAQTEWYPSDKQAYEGYGDDVIRVFNSVGVGTVKGWDGQHAVDIDIFNKRTQRIVASGNLRAVVESDVDGWLYEGKRINLKVRYILYARHRDAICEVTASENIDTLATGVQTIAGGPVMKYGTCLVGSWGTDYPVTDTVKYAKQTVGLGVFVPRRYALCQVKDGINNLILIHYKKGTTLRFNLTAAALKEEAKPFKSATDFFAYLRKWSLTLEPMQTR